jgi:hypothetical protein
LKVPSIYCAFCGLLLDLVRVRERAVRGAVAGIDAVVNSRDSSRTHAAPHGCEERRGDPEAVDAMARH